MTSQEILKNTGQIRLNIKDWSEGEEYKTQHNVSRDPEENGAEKKFLHDVINKAEMKEKTKEFFIRDRDIISAVKHA